MAFLSMIGGLYMLVMLLPGIGVGIRRMHDVGKSGWFMLIPIYNLILAFTEGDKGPNEYVEDPSKYVIFLLKKKPFITNGFYFYY